MLGAIFVVNTGRGRGIGLARCSDMRKRLALIRTPGSDELPDEGHSMRTTEEEFRDRLREARNRLHRTVARTDDELATLEAHQPGASSEDVTTEQVTAILSRLEGQEKHELDEIDAAQARLGAGTYGVCEGCAKPIPLARLRAVLTARHCMSCQLALEK
jgi:DnaK suppressor protein